MAIQTSKRRGGLIDVVTLVEYPFYFDPTVKGSDKTTFSSQHVIGNRLASRLWVGEGTGDIDLDVFILDQTNMLAQLEAFRSLTLSQADTGTPHPVYVIVGGLYVGRQFVLCSLEHQVLTMQFDQTMVPYEIMMKLKLEEIPVVQ